MEFIILGSGTSAGVPIIGCDCETCTSRDPRDQRTRPGAALRFVDASGQERVILLDATPDLRQQVLRHDIRRCDSILFTHSHVDHTFGLDDVRRFNAVMRSEIDIYGEPETLADLRRVYRHIFLPEQNVNQSWVAKIRSHELEVERPVDLFGLRITPLRLWHGNLPVLGFLIEDTGEGARGEGLLPLAYLTDVSRIPDETWPRVQGVRTLILDMLRPRPHPTHFSVEEAIEASGRIGAGQTWFIHMTHEIRHADLDATLPAGMALSHDGLRIRGRVGGRQGRNPR